MQWISVGNREIKKMEVGLTFLLAMPTQGFISQFQIPHPGWNAGPWQND